MVPIDVASIPAMKAAFSFRFIDRCFFISARSSWERVGGGRALSGGQAGRLAAWLVRRPASTARAPGRAALAGRRPSRAPAVGRTY